MCSQASLQVHSPPRRPDLLFSLFFAFLLPPTRHCSTTQLLTAQHIVLLLMYLFQNLVYLFIFEIQYLCCSVHGPGFWQGTCSLSDLWSNPSSSVPPVPPTRVLWYALQELSWRLSNTMCLSQVHYWSSQMVELMGGQVLSPLVKFTSGQVQTSNMIFFFQHLFHQNAKYTISQVQYSTLLVVKFK